MIMETLQNALMISGFVLVMMLVIEYLNVLTEGGWDKVLGHWKWGQSAFSSFLGATPGCLGAYVVSSLYIHRVVTFGSLVAAMVATCGDESFVMLALFPGKALMIFAILFLSGIITGIVADVILNRRLSSSGVRIEHYQPTHKDEDRCVPFSRTELMSQWRSCSPQRGLLSLILVLFISGVIAGKVGHNHMGMDDVMDHQPAGIESLDEHGHDHHDANAREWDWMRVTLLLIGIVGLMIVVTVPEHFLEEHLWNHLVKIHVWKIFLWTTAALFIVQVFLDNFDVVGMVHKNALPVLLLACLVGLIPQSGPHMIFVTLYAEGSIPFSTLMASCIVQDGHGMIPVLAHSRRAFLAVKAGKFVIGMAVGIAGQWMGW